MSSDRWEFCPYCRDGFPEYAGSKKGFHIYNCSSSSCEANFKVQEGFGNYDKRQGMALSSSVIYLEICDGCTRLKPVKVKNLRFSCVDCFNK